MKRVVQFSGGLCSFFAANRVIERYGREDVTLLFAKPGKERMGAMSVPMNGADFKRFANLAEILADEGLGEISVYTSKDCTYVSLEIRASGVPAGRVREVFGLSPYAPTSLLPDNSETCQEPPALADTSREAEAGSTVTEGR